MTGSSRTAGNRSGSEWLTVEEVCTELKISPRTFYRWRAQAPARAASALPGAASVSGGAGSTSG